LSAKASSTAVELKAVPTATVVPLTV